MQEENKWAAGTNHSYGGKALRNCLNFRLLALLGRFQPPSKALL